MRKSAISLKRIFENASGDIVAQLALRAIPYIVNILSNIPPS